MAVLSSSPNEHIVPEVGETFNLLPPLSWSNTQAMDGTDRLNLWPVYVPEAMTISSTAIQIRSAASAGAWRLGWYALDGAGGVPYTLIGDCGTIDPTGTGTKTASASVTLPRGWVSFGMAHQSSSSGGTYAGAVPTVGVIRGITAPSHNGWYRNSTAGAFPATITISSGMGGYAPPAVMVTRSA